MCHANLSSAFVLSGERKNVVVVVSTEFRRSSERTTIQRLLLVVPATNTIASFFPPWTLLIITDLGLCDGSSPISPVSPRSETDLASSRNLYRQPPLLDDSPPSPPPPPPPPPALCNSAAIVSHLCRNLGTRARIESRVPSQFRMIRNTQECSSGEEDEGVDETETQEEGFLGRHGGHAARNGLASATLPVRVVTALSVNARNPR